MNFVPINDDFSRYFTLYSPRTLYLFTTVPEYLYSTRQLMLAVAAHAPSNPEAQVVLGVLYNISQDFDNATECFSRAIELSPPDYTLLNKVVSRAHRLSSCLSKSHSQPPLSVLSIISST
jgi:uncharacterized protein HemY